MYGVELHKDTMKKLLLSLVLTLTALNSYAWTQRPNQAQAQCIIHAPHGFPATNQQMYPICREGYFVGYDSAAKLPKYVTYTITPQTALGCFPRTNAFVKDETTPNGARPDDYAGTGYDKGHMSPDGDQSWSQQVEYESFLMTNMAPQAGSLNRGIWKLLETNVRGWAVQLNQPYTVYVGGIYGVTDKKIGNGVVVPHGFYKIVINYNTNEVAGWMFPHTEPYPNLGNDLTKFRVGVATIEGTAAVKFAFPANAKELPVGAEWPIDYGALTKAKRAKCGANAQE
jgi:endonuclease G